MTAVNEADIALRITELERELDAARDALAGALTARLAAAESEVASLRGDYDALRAEYTLINEELALRSAELLQVRAEMETAEADAAAAAAEVRLLKSELERLQVSPPVEVLAPAVEVAPAAGSGTALAVAAVMVPAASAEPPLAESAPAPAAIISAPASAESAPDGWLGRAVAATEGEVTFQPDNSLTTIPCASADDIIELRVSINAIRICTDHTGLPHKSSAYICGIRRNGCQEVYVAVHQIDTERSIIYVPSRQPVEQGEYEKIMESAIAFADVTGFIINLVYLGGSPEDRAEAVRQIPVFGISHD